MEKQPFGFEEAHEAAHFIAEKVTANGLQLPGISLTLGSGLRTFADRYMDSGGKKVVIPYSDIPNFPIPETPVAGHDGKLIVAPVTGMEGTTLAIWAGRVHYYQQLFRNKTLARITDLEVRKAAIVFYIAICRALLVRDIVTSNAVGTVRPELFPKGSIVRVTDHILDPDEDFGVPDDARWFDEKRTQQPNYDYRSQDYFYSQGDLYSRKIGEMAREVATEMGFVLPEGVLHWRKGRGYESPAMNRFVQTKGADLVAMSTAPEAQKARSVGYSNKSGERHFGAFSLVSNVAQLTHEQVLQHGEVQEAGETAEKDFNPFMYQIIAKLMLLQLQAALEKERTT